MLYVFQVDTDMMMTFEMQLAMESVSGLKRAIAKKTCIPEDKQVLLISGGENLNPNQRVCSHSSAGTDTSPIFLFAKINIESQQPPTPQVDYGNDTDLTEMIESCMAMQPNYDTLVARTELAATLFEQAAKQKEICERLVHDQHLKQQGWAAVTANLEDLIRAFRNKAEMLLSAFSEFMKNKSTHQELIDRFSSDIQLLSKIPILPSLIEHNKLNIVPPSRYIPQRVNDSLDRSMTTSSSPSRTTACPILTFPIAFVVGALGYFVETKFRNQEPTPVRDAITKERDERHRREQLEEQEKSSRASNKPTVSMKREC